MCGIFAAYDPQKSLTPSQLLGASKLLIHRGPDNQGYEWLNRNTLFFHHSRLKIIDLENHSNQPLSTEDRRFTVIFNGEIYNYQSLRLKIGSQWNWKTNSDTEVILACWTIYGKNCLDMLEGMFAFLIYDQQQQKLFIARDRFGIKPLYYCKQNKKIFFSSEIPPLLQFLPQKLENKKIIKTYLETGFYDHCDQTFFKDIYNLEAGCFMEMNLQDSSVQIKRWYTLADKINKNINKKSQDLIDEAEELIFSSIKSNMIADVNVGLNVSGGVDSSMLVKGALANQSKIHLFNQDYEGYSELEWVNLIAGNCPLHVQSLDFNSINNVLEKTIKLQAEPFGGVMVCGYNQLYADADRNNITVLLDGNGVDEIFLGYKKYHLQYVQNSSIQTQRKHIDEYEEFWGTPFTHLSSNHSIDGTFGLAPECIGEEIQLEELVGLDKPEHSDDPVKNTAIKDLLYYKIPRGLRFNDRMSMGYSKELRVPFLEHKLVEFALGLPAGMLIDQKGTKSVFRDILAKHGGQSVAYAKKRSIQSPQREWLSKNWSETILEILHSTSFKQRGWVDSLSAIKAYEGYVSGNKENSFFIWQWLNLELWAREFLDK